MIERQDLLVFAKAAKHLNFASAAKELKITAPQVSKVISKLEESYKKTLFIRNTRMMRLSEHGEALLPVAEQALHSFSDVDELFAESESDADVSGLLRISCAHTLGVRVLAQIVSSFRRKYPKIHIQVLLADNYEDLIEQNLDMALRIFKPDDSSLIVRKLGENPVVICASPSYVAKHPIRHARELKNHSVLYIPTHGDLKFQKLDISLKKLCNDNLASSTNGDFLTQIAKFGCSIVARSKWSVTSELADGSLIELDLKDHLVSDTAIYAVYPQRKFVPKRLRLWLDHLFAEFPTGAPPKTV